jgi:hypothetical protein
MIDKRPFYRMAMSLLESVPEQSGEISEIISNLDRLKPISRAERIDLMNAPEAFIERIYNADGGWTTKLHTIAANGAQEILQVEPRLLRFKNSEGTRVIDAFLDAIFGADNGMTDYMLIEKLLDTPMEYSHLINTAGEREEGNLLDEPDVDGRRILDRITDFAYGSGDYQGNEPDKTVQEILSRHMGKAAMLDPEDRIEPLDARGFEDVLELEPLDDPRF